MNTPKIKHRARISVLILAAGEGRRMGGRAKCLLDVQGQSLLERLMGLIHSEGFHSCVLVLGFYACDIQAHLKQWPAHLVPRQVIYL